MAELFTLGYEGIDQFRFLKVLISREITTVVDVRARPLSRKKGFSKNGLGASCEAIGIGYEHWAPFGCPKPILDQYRIDGDWPSYTRKFKKHLPSVSDSIEELASRVLKERLCLVCFEADPAYCHRSFIAAAAAELCNRIEIVHLTGRGLSVAVK